MKINRNIWIFTILLVIATISHANEESDSMDDYYGSVIENMIQSQPNIANDKRSCIRRNLSCDHRPNDCCPRSVCRCNLWGTNCRCQRLGLFQKWGKR